MATILKCRVPDPPAIISWPDGCCLARTGAFVEVAVFGIDPANGQTWQVGLWYPGPRHEFIIPLEEAVKIYFNGYNKDAERRAALRRLRRFVR